MRRPLPRSWDGLTMADMWGLFVGDHIQRIFGPWRICYVCPFDGTAQTSGMAWTKDSALRQAQFANWAMGLACWAEHRVTGKRVEHPGNEWAEVCYVDPAETPVHGGRHA